LKEIGVEPVIADALDAAVVKAAVGRIRPDAVINEIFDLGSTQAGADGTQARAGLRRVLKGNADEKFLH
jgi:hypothetical protein